MLFRGPLQAFWSGVRDLLPMLSGILPFGLIAGSNGSALGFSPEMIIGMTMLLFAGSAQLVVYQMLQDGAVPLVILLTALVVNIRFAIYSAAFAPLLHPLPARYRWPLTYLISDQAYGLCSSVQIRQQHSDMKLCYYAGAALAMWCCWTLSVIAGIAVGAQIPTGWSLEFAVPLAFLTMLVGTLTSRTMIAVALVAGVCATLFKSLPYNSGFIFAVVAGVSFGLVCGQLFVKPVAVED